MNCSRDDLIYVSEECPALKILVLPAYLCREHSDIIPSLIVKFKNLEILSIGSTSSDWIVKIFELICIQLPNFHGMCVTSQHIDDNMALAIVKLLPKLKRLYMNGADLSKENLLLIMRGCKELECLHVRDCIGFEEDDEEILKLSSSIRNFRCDGSTSYDDSNCYMDIYDGDDCSD
ncbi:hypothetical protein POM88_036056 [Heracleum sosnowskyi]|uniref:F-box/LRR-repeat protein n=1 Tax=Heracleum sosnowskyi TaxID=360622 RepID=A0AAD8HPS6_9APIA|nr:hypothetical protein POM88_036047 [Heracleum sosnowskyi]KAK1369958.1 hypothetical protein POM88_036050 [Heracleum sosnowskyi]KAK1369961.1 hypothetical protein POM88_036053 [Heracleum sosnowskyi]KAK1369964.1 hypothetical protein POM88_036056 [Heracleum sosnowskyi]